MGEGGGLGHTAEFRRCASIYSKGVLLVSLEDVQPTLAVLSHPGHKDLMSCVPLHSAPFFKLHRMECVTIHSGEEKQTSGPICFIRRHFQIDRCFQP
jgi:hypothetical protein